MGYETELTEVVGPSGKSFRVYEDSSGNIQLRLGGTYTTNGYSVPFTLLQCGVPIGIAPTGTMGANGAVTLGTALNTTYSGGLWLYYAAGAVFSGSAAGFYWTVMSSTTAGTVYTNTYVPGTSSFDIPASPTAVVDAGPGAFTGVTSRIAMIASTLPGSAMGKNGSITVSYKDNRTNSAGAKTATFWFGGSNMLVSNAVANLASFSIVNTLRNCGREDRNARLDGASDAVGGSPTVSAYSSIDTSTDKAFSMEMQLSVATDWAVMYGFMVEVRPA